MTFTVAPIAAIAFPDSGWTLTLQKQDSDVVISLHWNNKASPTHQVACSIEDFKLMLNKAEFI